MWINYAALCDSFCTSCRTFSAHIGFQVSQVYSPQFFLFEYMNFIKIIDKEQLMMSQTWIFLELTSKAMTERKKKRRRRIYKELNISRTKKGFLDEIKNIFDSFWRAIIWWKIKYWIVIKELVKKTQLLFMMFLEHVTH